ncbi:putative tRNA-splicing endonuclease subunit, partial [Lachnellula subtilissima]
TQILHDLQHQHDWTFLTIHKRSTLTDNPLPRPIISGLPPRRAYIHPDEQIEILKAEHESGVSIKHEPEREWVLPSQIQETWSLAKFTAVFDALDTVPPGDSGKENEGKEVIKKPKTSRYPSLKGTDPKFRRNHRHALHGTMKALKELKEGKRDTA